MVCSSKIPTHPVEESLMLSYLRESMSGKLACRSRTHQLVELSEKRRFRPRLEVLEARTMLSAGDLDPAFGTGGKVLTDFVGPIGVSAKVIAIQADGNIIF